jgi:hypothetical protein
MTRRSLLALAALLAACTRKDETPPRPAAVEASAVTTAALDAAVDASPALDAGPDASAAALPPAPDDPCECMYLLAENGDLLRFSPTMKGLSRVGHPSCPLGEGGPRSMAVDRSGKAWIPALDGRIAEVNVHDASCTMTPFAAHQSGFAKLNLALAGPTLYAADDHGWGGDVAPSLGLATIDRTTWKLTPVHKSAARMHLAGTTAGALYAASPGVVETLARATYKGTDLKVPDLEKGPGAPMAYHLGALWFFGRNGVMRFDLASKTLRKVLPALSVTIDAAGGASCEREDHP